MEKKKKRGALLWVLIFAVLIAALAGVVYLIAAGYVDAAIDTVVRWGQDGTLDRVGVFLEETLPPLLISAAVGVSAILAAVLPAIAKVKKASEQIDLGTKKSVETTELAAQAKREMEAHREATDAKFTAFMGEMQAREDARAAEQRAALSSFMEEMRADTAAERQRSRRIEGSVRKLVHMEVLAHGADDALVKKGVASEIARVADEAEVSEGGDENGEDE